MSDNNLLIGVALLKGRVDLTKPLEDRLKAAMVAARTEIWFSTEPDLLMRCAIGAVLTSCSEEERQRITAELGLLRGLAAAQSGVPVNMAALIEGMDAIEPVGLPRLWQETEPKR